MQSRLDISQLEAYLFSENKPEFLKSLVSGSFEYDFFYFLSVIQSKKGELSEEEQKKFDKFNE